MTDAVFFRLLKSPIDDKGPDLAAAVAALNAGEPRAETYHLDAAEFGQIPGSPFAYWAAANIRSLFLSMRALADGGVSAEIGASTKDDFRFLRLWWEPQEGAVGYGLRWNLFSKGGAYALFYADTHLLVNWENDAREVREYVSWKYPYLRGNTGWVLHPESHYFRPGLTWPRRTQRGLNVRALPAGCIFADKGPSAFVPGDDPEGLLALLAVMNSAAFQALVKLQMAFGSWEVGVIQRTPVPPLEGPARRELAGLAREAHDLQRDHDRSDETAHAFGLPGLALHRAVPLAQASALLDAAERRRLARLAALRARIDDLAFDLYGVSAEDRNRVRAEMGQAAEPAAGEEGADVAEPTEDEEPDDSPAAEDLAERVRRLLMWCVGVAFGRWDVRLGLDPSRLPPLGDPFAPLPRCAPGALARPDGLPATREWLEAQAPAYPLPIAWDGILVDDPGHPSDIVQRVEKVLDLVWGRLADGVEREACAALGVGNLRDWFRDPAKGFFSHHLKRYSKSRRRAPIYWLLQSERRSYGIWLYCHRMRDDSLFVAARDYCDRKVWLEEQRLEDLGQGVDALAGSSLRQRERELERQRKLVDEVKAFRDGVDVAAKLMLPPDLNDGVVISIAPMRELTPWKEAGQMWDRLVAGQHPWSAMSKRMKARGYIKA